MIIYEPFEFEGSTFTKVYSDQGKYIISDETGVEYLEVVESHPCFRTYTEGAETPEERELAEKLRQEEEERLRLEAEEAEKERLRLEEEERLYKEQIANTTIEDLVDAINILTAIVLGEEE